MAGHPIGHVAPELEAAAAKQLLHGLVVPVGVHPDVPQPHAPGQVLRRPDQPVRQTGTPVYAEDGIMQKGTLVRHLILPGFTSESLRLLTWIRDELPPGTPVSLMRQYIPCNGVSVPGLDRRITEKEYCRVRDHMLALDLPGFLQEPDAADKAFIPVFNRNESFV